VLALKALNRIEKARGASKNLKGDISHDLKVSAAIARHAILAVCQRSTRFEAEATSREYIDKLREECLQLKERTEQLQRDLEVQNNSRLFLLRKTQSREPSPVRDSGPCPLKRGQKRDLRERRGETGPEPSAVTSAEAEHDPLVPEIIMGSPDRVEGGPSDDRPLSPMARYAAADPLFMGVLNDIAESLRSLKRRVSALERRPPPAPAPHPGEVGAGTVVATPGPTTGRRSRRRRRRGRGSGYPDPPPSASKQTLKRPVARARAGPLGPDVVTPARTASGRKEATAVSRVIPPGAAKPPPAKVTLSGARGATGKRVDKGKGRKAGTGGGQTPPPVGEWTTVRGRRSAPTTAGAAKAARVEKSAGQKATRPRAAGAAVPPGQSSKAKKKSIKAWIRRRLPRSAAVGLIVVPGGDATAATTNAILKRGMEEVPDARARFGIKTIRPRKTATGVLLLEIPGEDSARKADELASFLRGMVGEGAGVRITRPAKRVDLRLTGLSKPVTPRMVAEAISGFGAGCSADEVRVGAFRNAKGNRYCTCWVQAPAVAGVPAAEAGKVRLGWYEANVTLLKGRPLRCHRCLAADHVQQRCPSSVDRSRSCYNCGGEDHLAFGCRARPHCPLCEARGKTASHRPGSQGCPPVPSARAAGPGQPLPSRAGTLRARRTGPDKDGGGAAMDTAELPSPAGVAVQPVRAGGDASAGSSPCSPPGKKARTEVEPPSRMDVEPLPQRGPRPGVGLREEPVPEDEAENEAEEDVREGTWEAVK